VNILRVDLGGEVVVGKYPGEVRSRTFMRATFKGHVAGGTTGATTDMVMDALEMAVWNRRTALIGGVIAHSDAGGQYVSVRYTERLAEIGARPSIGSVGDCLLTGQYRACGDPGLAHFGSGACLWGRCSLQMWLCRRMDCS
jgi:transposase InsO family protein